MTATLPKEKATIARKLIFQLVLGGILGGLAGYSGVSVLDLGNTRADQVMVFAVGLIYVLIGFIVGFGLIAPKLGSKILNVEDEDELRDERRILSGSTISMVAFGLALMGLALAGPGGIISPLVSFGGLFTALLLIILVSIRDWKRYDEMLLDVSKDASTLAFYGICVVLLLWSSAAWFGWVASPTPLSLVALLSGGLLLASFIASARKGLLRPR